MDVGTAKPSVTERKNIPHFCLDELTPDREFNAGEFGKRGRGVIDEIFDRKNIPIVVGGSGLYIRAIIDGFFEGPSADPELRAALYREAHETGNERMLQALAQLDPEAARGMLPSNIRRIVRALEVYKLTGSTISELHKAALPKTFTPLFFGLRWDRRLLYRRIDERVDRMLEGGLMDEVLTIQRLGYTAQMNALQTVGYKEAFEHLDGKTTFEEMAALIKRNSRRYAKRQMTWFRRDGRIQWFDLRDEMELTRIAEEIVRTFRSL